MTKSVTATDVLVLSPVDFPEKPEDEAEIFDGFARVAVGLAECQLAGGWQDDGSPLMAHRGAPEPIFRATPLLRDGFTGPGWLPDSWEGRITLSIIGGYFAAEWLLYPREPDWGVHIPFDEVTPVEDGLRTRGTVPVKIPHIDPLRDGARPDDETDWPVRPELSGEWAGFLTSWEHVDGCLAGHRPGLAWLQRRIAHAVAPTGRVWWELRGLRDAGDVGRYGPQMWGRPTTVTLYLGWPAYFIAAAGETSRCEGCSRTAIRGRRYCAAPDCARARAAQRQRVSRAAQGRSR